jgi:plasmid maintenance system killer protein
LRKLFMISRARSLKDLQMLPGNRLELLKGDRRGQYSILYQQAMARLFQMGGWKCLRR